MKVTIITAVRNAAHTVQKTLDSVRAQDYADIEHIVIDGASTDGTQDCVRRAERVSMLLTEPDSGVYEAFNKGLALATGHVVAFLNAGDEYSGANTVSKIIHTLQNDEVDVVFGDVAIVDAAAGGRLLRKYSSRSFSPQRLRLGFMPAHPTLFMLKAVYDRVGGYDSSYTIAGDFELCTRVFQDNHVAYRYVSEVLVRMAHGGLSNSGWRSKWVITREMQRACKENAIRTSLPLLLMRLPLKALELGHRLTAAVER